MIGTTARTLLVGGGGSSRVIGVTDREVSPLTALRRRAGAGGHVTFRVGRDVQGVAVPSSALTPPNAAPGQHGLLRTNTVTGATQIDPNIDFVGANALPEGTQATWTGTLTAPTTGDYLLAVQTAGTGASLTVDGQPVVSGGILALLGTTLHRTTDGLANSFAHLHLTAGPHTISVTAAPIPAFPPFIEASSGPVQIRLAWITPQQRQANLAAAAAAAKRARTAVVFAYMEGTEGVDQPTLALPDEQDQLIEAVAGQPPHGGRAQQRLPGADALGQAGPGHPGHVVPRPGGRAGDRRPVGRRRGTRRQAAGDVPGSGGRRPDRDLAAALPRRQRPGVLQRRDLRRLPLVRPAAHRAAVPLRLRPVLYQLRLPASACPARPPRRPPGCASP